MQIPKIIIPTLVLISFLSSCTFEDIDDTYGKAEEIIAQESELFDLVDRVNKETADEKAITCIDFIFPVALYTTDSAGQISALTSIGSNTSFVDFLDNLGPNDYISISYPIEATLSDGGYLSINNNQQLQDSIEACVAEEREEIIAECNGALMDCLWKVGYAFNNSNEFLGASFDGLGVIDFTYGDQVETGSWNGLFIENDLYININLLGNHDAATFFNHNWQVEVFETDRLLLTTDSRELVLNKYCTDDQNECFNLNFESCELDQNPGFAEFVLDDYKYCISEILRIDAAQSSFEFYNTVFDAEHSTNPMNSSQTYVNTDLVETKYVRVNDGQSPNNMIVEISLIVANCS